MINKFNTSLFIFRRDLRLADNTALMHALAESKQVIACFIFDPEQIGPKNRYKSDNCIQFMLASLTELGSELTKQNGRLYLFHGNATAVAQKLVKAIDIDALYINHDYTPFSLQRDTKLAELCAKNKMQFFAYHDALLHAPQVVLKKDGKPYTVFTPFFKKAHTVVVEKPQKNSAKNYYTKPLLAEWNPHNNLTYKNKQLASKGGRAEGLKILNKIAQFKDYDTTHDVPALATTHLSPHNKFGTISIREVYHAIQAKLGKGHPLIRQLYWRDFFTLIAFYFPRVFGGAFHEKYDHLTWKNDAHVFKRWCTGTTGFPIVDAGMRELNATGFMHNRVRMIVASFLIKDLHIDWRMGERYFAQTLVDYDPAVNNGNWQWVASTGCDAQPYFRIFNPWLQQKKFDAECMYIKKWLPELKNLSPKIVHAWYKHWKDNANNGYPAPMIDHAYEAALTKKYYKKI